LSGASFEFRFDYFLGVFCDFLYDIHLKNSLEMLNQIYLGVLLMAGFISFYALMINPALKE
jgi:hypothetical protein